MRNPAMFKEEVKRLVILGVQQHENDSKLGTPYIAEPKPKTNWVILLSDFRNLNRQLKYKPYTMLEIHEVLVKL